MVLHASKVTNLDRPLLVKSRQISRERSAKKFLWSRTGKEAEITHQMRLIAIAGFEGDFGKAFSLVP